MKWLRSKQKGERGEPRHLRVGLWGESVAADYLKRQGMRILGKRVRVGRRDEIDIIARDGQSLVFVEVKTRGSDRFGRPASAVDRAKRHTLSRAAVRYLQKLPNPRVCFRFDVVEVIGEPGSEGDAKVNHIHNAFGLDRRYMLP